jgi:penicillin-binding protein 1A
MNYILIRIIAVIAILFAGLIGIGLGLSLAATTNIQNAENYESFNPALPSKVYTNDGDLLTEFSADEKRELVGLSELPRHLILAVITREDPDFYNHRGFSLRGIARASVGVLTNRSLGGGSTITQQVAGTLYTNRMERTISRKLRELWWAFQMERRFTKNEILEIYLNYMIMGPGTYGVEAASQYFFGHSARDITLAEAAVLVVQLSSPTRYNPILNPNEAMDRQMWVLERMVETGYASREEADESFKEYWDSWDYTRVSSSAYFSREDKAPWFSEYVRRELEKLMYGEMDYYRDGYNIQTTLDLEFQSLAESEMRQGIERGNTLYRASSKSSFSRARVYVPVVNLLALTFNLEGIYEAGEDQGKQRALSHYAKTLNPTVDMAALIFDVPEVKAMTGPAYNLVRSFEEDDTVEGALIVLENETGYIKALIGGSKFDEHNQLIRATQAKIMPGSAFKPLYYSAAIDSREFTMATLIYDTPMVFYDAIGNPYVPFNYQGSWRGPVLLYEALALSLNIPALKVLDGIGFDAAINRSAALLGITDPEEKSRTFPRVYPMGLGIIAVSPLQMARAFAVFANQGRDVTPIAIKTVEDREGKIIIDNERDIRLAQRQMGSNIQVISPQNAYMMTKLLDKVITVGTLASGSGYGAKLNVKDDKGVTYRIPAGGKTGTTQNWSDGWAVGFTPYYTIAIWFGFDKPGNSLGMNVSGASLAGPIWGNLMQAYNQGLPRRDFVRPSGITEGTVCRDSGMLRNSDCPSGISLTFLAGTVPTEVCDLHGEGAIRNTWDPYERTSTFMGPGLNMDLQMPTLPPELLQGFSATPEAERTDTGVEIPSYNPLWD